VNPALAAATLGVAAAGGGAYLRLSAWARRVEAELRAVPDPWAGTDLGPLGGDTDTVSTDDGAELRVVELGDPDGRPVVLVHGYVGNTSTWALVAPRLAEAGHRVIAFDQRGHGSSTAGSDGFGIPHLGRDLAAVLADRDVRDAVVVGHSMGGISVLALAAEDAAAVRGRVAAAVLLSTTANGPGRPPLIGLKRPLRKMAWFELARARPRIGRAFARRAYGDAPAFSLVDASWRAYLATAVHTLNEAGEPLLQFDLRHAMTSLTVPTTVAVGSGDRITPVVCSELIHAALPTSELVVWEGAGHVTPLERPAEVVALVDAAARR
jgi:pimeloyl-ACP methyl ester carboxylesterase